MIHLDHVTVTFPDGDSRITAVNDVSLRGEPGTVTGIIGPSGSGKSSLLAVASTLVSPDSGHVWIDDVDAAQLTAKEAAVLRRERLGIVFQQSNLLPALSSFDQLRVMNHLGGRASRRETNKVNAKAAELLAAVGLAGQEHKRPHQLSGGQRQRVNIARALMNDPRVLIVDEPTSALDQQRGAEIIDLILRLSQDMNTATLLVTHDLVHLPRMDAVVEMVDGRLSTARSTALVTV
ncbi:MAG: ABC transporter ATP-binding protein [Aeromicrobium sp.]|nr:MAG: ABC transporter ATP-binding protein [Aeromicrobium sp.]